LRFAFVCLDCVAFQGVFGMRNYVKLPFVGASLRDMFT